MSKPAAARSERKSDQTRQLILQAAFMEIYHKGYQGMRLDDVLAETGLTKGALYHHFSSKQTLGYAVVEEIIQPMMESIWVEPLQKDGDPIAGLITVIEALPDAKPAEVIQYGCPLNNLVQEMSPQDEGFRERLNRAFSVWHDAIQVALEKAVKLGRIRTGINCDETAAFIIAALEGCIGMAKSSQSLERLRGCLRGVTQYLHSLKV